MSLMLSGLGPQAASRACGVSRATAYRLRQRYQQGGWDALWDRPSRPRRQPRRLTVQAEREIVAIRERTEAGPVVIGVITGRPASTVGKVLRRWGCSRLPRPERDPVRRYERERPGELIHVDTKRLGCFQVVGKRILRRWQEPQPPSRLAAPAHRDRRPLPAGIRGGAERAKISDACAAFLRRAVAWYASYGIEVERVLSDNAKAYHSHLTARYLQRAGRSPVATRGRIHPGRTARPKR